MVDEPMRRALVLLYPRLRRFAIRLAGSVVDADDLVQHACERALSFDRHWKPGTRLDSWLYRLIQKVLER
jgi:RNA polymerase sigma-70 factor, ECF subfamily